MREVIARMLRRYAGAKGRGYPDWAIRYVPIVRWLERSGLSGKRILEVGANENGLAQFAKTPVVALDIELEHLRAARSIGLVKPVCADIAALPFASGTFDVVVSVDTFEHINEESRNMAVEELLRIVGDKGRVVVAFPSGVDSARAEAFVNERCKSFSGQPVKWLEEHVEMGLPEGDQIADQIRRKLDAQQRVTVRKNANLRVWQWMWVILMGGWPGFGNAFFQAVLHFITPVLCYVHVGPCYRTILYVEPKKP